MTSRDPRTLAEKIDRWESIVEAGGVPQDFYPGDPLEINVILARGYIALHALLGAVEGERNELKEEITRLRILLETASMTTRMVLDMVQKDLVEASVGLRHDGSWMRPLRLPSQERLKCLENAVLRINKALTQMETPEW